MTFINAKNILMIDEKYNDIFERSSPSVYYVKFVTLFGAFQAEYPKTIYEEDIRPMIEEGKGLIPIDGQIEERIQRA